MRITYRTLGHLIAKMSDEQKDSDVTVEINEGNGGECFAGHLRIAGDDHDSLDPGHPVIYSDLTEDHSEYIRTGDIKRICENIGL